MFSSTYPGVQGHAGSAGAYRQVGVETSLVDASPHKLVQMLYDGLVEAIAQARGAIRQRALPAKAAAFNRALGILEDGLHAGLNLQAGGALAANLSDLYTYVAKRLAHANAHNDEAALDECIHLIEPLREAWAGIARQVGQARQ